MQILVDECLPRKLKRDLVGHAARTVPEAGWAGRKNGELLRLAAGAYDVLLTADHGLPHEQNLKSAQLAVIVLSAPSNRYADIRPLVPEILTALAGLRPGQLVRIGS